MPKWIWVEPDYPKHLRHAANLRRQEELIRAGKLKWTLAGLVETEDYVEELRLNSIAEKAETEKFQEFAVELRGNSEPEKGAPEQDPEAGELRMTEDDRLKLPILSLIACKWAPEQTPGDEALCGVYALKQAIANHQALTHTATGVRRCSFERLIEFFGSKRYQELVAQTLALLPWDVLDETMLEESDEYLKKNWLSVAQLDILLTVVNENINTNYCLGIISQGYTSEHGYVQQTAAQFGREDANVVQPILWIHNDNAGKSSGLGNHWSSIGPAADRDWEMASKWTKKMESVTVQKAGLYIVTQDIVGYVNVQPRRLDALAGTFLYKMSWPDKPVDEKDWIMVKDRRGQTGIVPLASLTVVSEAGLVDGEQNINGNVWSAEIFKNNFQRLLMLRATRSIPENAEVPHKWPAGYLPYEDSSLVRAIGVDDQHDAVIAMDVDGKIGLIPEDRVEAIEDPWRAGAVRKMWYPEEFETTKLVELRKRLGKHGVKATGSAKKPIQAQLAKYLSEAWSFPLTFWKVVVSGGVFAEGTYCYTSDDTTEARETAGFLDVNNRYGEMRMDQLEEKEGPWGIRIEDEDEKEPE